MEIALANAKTLRCPFVKKRFMELHEVLMSHGGLLYSQAIRHCDRKPYWLREINSGNNS